MAEKPKIQGDAMAQDVLPAPKPKVVVNPAFRMMGLPRFKLKLPSRNWLIFLSITGSFATTLLYDRHHKRKAQRRWCNLVSHLAQEPLPINLMPRRITIFLAAPPGDGLRVVREHFHEYIKPILVAGALDWEVIEGRREGEVRAGLAEKIRKLRKRNGEKPPLVDSVEDGKEGEEELLEQARRKSGIGEWDGVQGDLILGRHTWKEYVRGLHEGWLGPLDTPPPPSSTEVSVDPLPPTPTPDAPPSQDPESTSTEALSDTPSTPPTPVTPPSKTHSPLPAFISPTSYPTAPLSPSIPSSLPPSLPLPLPHLLGFLNTPIRFYRFLTQRHLADQTGAAVAALVLASHSRPYEASLPLPGSDAPVTTQADNTSSAPHQAWEQDLALKAEETEWHKSVWKDVEGALPDAEREWREPMVLDERIATRMRLFELAPEEAARAERGEWGGDEDAGGSKKTKNSIWGGWVDGIRAWMGDEREEVRGWEMGLVGGEDE